MKKNGFAWPPPWHQIVSWMLYAINKTFFFIFTNKFFIKGNKNLLEIIFSIISLITTILGFICTYLDPSDDMLIKELQKRKKANLNKQSYVLEISKNLDFCIICSSNIDSKSKHCRICDRCVSDFDHHCSWLNNCIGGKNYIIFFSLLLFTFADLSYNMSVSIYSIHIYYTSTDEDLLFIQDMTSNPELYIVFVIILTALNLFVIANIIYLISIHTWLRCNGLTTYDYISKEEEKKVDNSEDKALKRKRNMFPANELLNAMNNHNKLKNVKMQHMSDKIVIEDNENVFKPIIDDIYFKNSKGVFIPTSVNVDGLNPHMIQVTNHNSILSGRNNDR